MPDLDRAVARALECGASLDRDIQDREYGRIANVADPFGNGFDLIEFAPGGYALLQPQEKKGDLP